MSVSQQVGLDWRAQKDMALVALEREQRAAARAEAAGLLCELASDGPEQAAELVDAIPRLLADAQSEVRCAGLALAGIALTPDEAEPVLVRGLADPATRVRVEAAGRLADLARPSSRGAFAAALGDASFSVRFEAARGMASLKHSAGLDVLVEALDDGDFRFRALGALAELGDARALPAVQRLWRKWLLPYFDRTQAAGTLVKLGDPSGIEHLFARTRKKWTVDRGLAVELLGEVRAPGAFERLSALVADKRDASRGAAARALGRLGDARARPVLLEIFGAEDTPDDVRLDAAEGLCRLGADEDLSALEAAASQAKGPLKAELQEMLADFRAIRAGAAS